MVPAECLFTRTARFLFLLFIIFIYNIPSYASQDANYGFGVFAYEEGNLKKAHAFLKKALAENPDDTRCNYGDWRRETTPVGRYSPQGDSPYGCADIAGNVWEWTRSLWGESWERPDFGYPYDPEDGREDLGAGREVRRVLRGGAFNNYERLVRCAYRSAGRPGYRSDLVGFRLCVVSQQD